MFYTFGHSIGKLEGLAKRMPSVMDIVRFMIKSSLAACHCVIVIVLCYLKLVWQINSFSLSLSHV